MDNSELEERLKERSVFEVANSVYYQLMALSLPDGKVNHKRNEFAQYFFGRMYLYESGAKAGRLKREETFEQYKARDPKRYSDTISCLKQTIERFKVTF